MYVNVGNSGHERAALSARVWCCGRYESDSVDYPSGRVGEPSAHVLSALDVYNNCLVVRILSLLTTARCSRADTNLSRENVAEWRWAWQCMYWPLPMGLHS